jgi:hypothetical protein
VQWQKREKYSYNNGNGIGYAWFSFLSFFENCKKKRRLKKRKYITGANFGCSEAVFETYGMFLLRKVMNGV